MSLVIALLFLAPLQCESLTSFKLSNGTITLAQSVSAGAFAVPGTEANPNPAFRNLPGFCRVAATLRPVSDSDIKIEVWLPLTTWNGKFQAVGNGGWAGTITYSSGAGGVERGMAEAINRGYATASTDTGHIGADAKFAFGHPEKMVDYAYRAIHETTVAAKAIVDGFYGAPPRFSYWNGCSTGGRQGLMEAQRYPDDFDAIIAGAPANYMTHLESSHIAEGSASLRRSESALTSIQHALLKNAAVQACDALDGVKDGLITDPRTCQFDPGTLLCRNGDSQSCLTSAQVESSKTICAPTKKQNGELVFPGLEPGSELGWGPITNGPEPFGVSMWMFRYLHNDMNWDWRSFDLDKETSLVDEKLGFINAIAPDLSKFKDRGGKLLLYHGWNDPLIAPENTVDYYSKVLSKMGTNQSDWLRLFMAPGMNHCGGGDGPNAFDAITALEKWRENGEPPNRIIAAHTLGGKVDRTRPLCPYPQVAKYKGDGSIDDASNFECKAP